MGSYKEMSTEPFTFYVDSFNNGELLQIVEVVRAIGGAIEYDRLAHHLDEPRARHKVTLPAGCEHEGLDTNMAPQTITLPGGPHMRKLCIYPQPDSVLLAWLPGDSADPTLWDGARRKPQEPEDTDE